MNFEVDRAGSETICAGININTFAYLSEFDLCG